MATVNAAREEFEAAKTAALRAAGKVAEEAVIRVLVILLDIIIVVLLEKTTRKTSRNSGLPPSQTDKSVPEATARARSRTGRWATTCARPSSRKRLRPATPAALTSTAPSIGSAASSMTSCSRSSSAAPRSRNARSARAGSPTTSRAVRHPGPRHQPAGRPDAIPAPSRSCRRSPASSSPRQPASAMLSRCVMGGGRRGAPPATPSPACRRDRISDQQ